MTNDPPLGLVDVFAATLPTLKFIPGAYADDLAELVEKLDLKDAIHVGHSIGGGEIARYIARHGTSRLAKAALISATSPLMLKTTANPGGLPIEVFDQLRAGVQADRSQVWKDLSLQFYGYNRPGAKISKGVRKSFWLQGMRAGFPASYFCIKAFSETDTTEDLKRFDVSTPASAQPSRTGSIMSSSRSSRHEPAGPTPNSQCGPRAFSEETSRCRASRHLGGSLPQLQVHECSEQRQTDAVR